MSLGVNKKADGAEESGKRSNLVALVNTGADWSLIKESEMSKEERAELQPTDMVGQG